MTTQQGKKTTIMKVGLSTLLLFLFLQVMTSICTFIILFLQGRPQMVNDSFLQKLLANEFWTSVEWVFALPSIRLGYSFLTVPQVILVTYLFGFFVQILVDIFWLKVPVYIDTYACMVIMMVAMAVAKLKWLG